MAETRTNYISLESATGICEAGFGYRGPDATRSWFSIFISEGLLRLDHIFHDDHDDPFAGVQDIYRFSYQHFSDHLIVQALLETVDDIEDAFRPDGSLRFLVEDDSRWAWSFLWNALSVQIPEKFAGKELFDVLPVEIENPTDYYTFREAFEHSLLWRSKTAFSDRTIELFNEIAKKLYDPRLDILIRLATLQDHPWNTQLIDRTLQRLPLSERDAFWTVHINAVTDDDRHPLWELIRWSLTANLEPAETETLHLAAITLAWVFTSSSRPLRDTATKALTVIFVSRPQLIPALIEHFQHVDDLYVMERICAAVLGAITRESVRTDIIRSSAQAIYQAIFARETPPLNILLRDYALAVIEYALSQDCLDHKIAMKKCRPPYQSPWPLSDVTEEEVKQIAKESGNDEILISVCSSLGDFSRYEVEPAVRHLSSIPLNQSKPLNNEERKNIFLEKLASWDKQKQAAFDQLKSAVNEETASMRIQTRWENGSIIISSSEKLEERVKACEAHFTSLLCPNERETYEQLMLPSLFPHRVPDEDRRIPQFDAEFAKRWIAKRAYAYGWNNEIFPHDHGDSNYNRERPRVERIGKKYQWLALSEFLASLVDNVWVVSHWPEQAMVYDHPVDWLIRDIEPSVLIDPKPPLNENRWWQAVSLHLEPIQDALLSAWPFQEEPPNVPDWLDVVAPDGTSWLLLYGFFHVREDRTQKNFTLIDCKRDIFVRVSTILVEAHTVDTAISKLKQRRLSDPTGHDAIDWTDSSFLCEYPWRNTWRADCSPYENENFGNLTGIRYIRPMARYVWESHLDGSLQNGASVYLPNPWIGAKLDLKPNLDYVGEFVAEPDRQKIFIDPAVGISGTSAALVYRERFFKFLQDEGLVCLWIVAGERNAYPSGRHGDYACRSFASVYRWTGTQWTGEKWHKDESKSPNN